MKYKLVIFDLDGTILNTLDDLTDNLNKALMKSNFQPRTKMEVRSYAGNGVKRLVQRGVPTGTSDEAVEIVYQDFLKIYQEHCEEQTRPYEGILDLFHKLQTDGYKIAVVSNKVDIAVKKLCDKFFAGLVDTAVGERENIPKKPEPDSVNEVLNQFHINRKEAVYIGDSEVDIQTANNADMDCIAVEWGFRDREVLVESGAKKIVSTTEELYDRIKNG